MTEREKETTTPPERPETEAAKVIRNVHRDPGAIASYIMQRCSDFTYDQQREQFIESFVEALLTGVAAAATPPDPQRPTFGHDPHVGEMTAECAPMYFRGKETEAWAAGYNRVPEPRTVKLGVIEFHSPSFNPGLMERFYAVTKDLTAAGCIVDLWLMDIATVLSEFGYTMTIATDRPAPTLAMPTPTLK